MKKILILLLIIISITITGCSAELTVEPEITAQVITPSVVPSVTPFEEYAYIIVEEDGDFELLWHTKTGWHYEQILGGKVVELIFFGHNPKGFVLNFFGEHMQDFIPISIGDIL